MRIRIRLPRNRWRDGTLRIKWVDRVGRHARLSVSLTTSKGQEVSFEVQDKDIYRLADNIVDHADEYFLNQKQHQGEAA